MMNKKQKTLDKLKECEKMLAEYHTDLFLYMNPKARKAVTLFILFDIRAVKKQIRKLEKQLLGEK